MPETSGPELAKQLTQQQPEMKVLFMSGYADDSIFRHGLLDPQVAYVQKPLTPKMLSARVREVLDAPPEVAA
jgi:DNA-binding NarL/FixJ family response regulator